MVDTVTPQILHDGPRNLVVKTSMDSDGTGQSNAILINVSDFVDSVGATLARVRIMKIEAALGTWGAELLWDATTNVPIVTIHPDFPYSKDWTDIGGISNDAGTGITGDILWTTSTLGADETGYITLYMKKQ